MKEFMDWLTSYWGIMVMGVIVMAVINVLRRKKAEFNAGLAILFTILVTIYSFFGAKVLFMAENWSRVQSNGIQWSGVSFFGSVFFAPILVWLTCKLARLDYGKIMDYLTPALVVMLAILRIDCYFEGCCGGITITRATGGSFVVPTQIIECIFDIVICVLLLWYEYKLRIKGSLYPLFLFCYGILRFIVEFVRDTPKDWAGMSHAQWFAIIAIVVGVIQTWRMYKGSDWAKARRAAYEKQAAAQRNRNKSATKKKKKRK